MTVGEYMRKFASVREEAGVRKDWISISSFYGADFGSPLEDFNISRTAAVSAMGDLLEKTFKDQCGENADPADWRLIVLRKWWMRETNVRCEGKVPIPNARISRLDEQGTHLGLTAAEDGKAAVVFIDSTFRFEKA